MEHMRDVPARFIVYQSSDSDEAQPYTVIYPDGVVFLFDDGDSPKGIYLCRLMSFSPREEDLPVRSVRENLLKQILAKEA
jgi:hypothetical protein